MDHDHRPDYDHDHRADDNRGEACWRAWRTCQRPPPRVTGSLAKALTTTNCTESMISVARTTMRNVKTGKTGR